MNRSFRARLGASLPALGIVLGLATVCAQPAQAQFALAVSPPRFELSTEAGKTVRDVVELSQASPQPGTYKIKTADWSQKPDGSLSFSDELVPGSCRPWVAIERREVTVTEGRPYRFRFEVSPPPDAPSAECRFAIVIEGQEVPTGGQVSINLNARIAVIVYVAVGKAAPQLELVGSAVQTIDGKPVPVLRIRNSGDAHGRLAGFLTGTDAGGTALELQASTLPIMPGETRELALTANKPGNPDTPVAIRLPVAVKGKLEWGRQGTLTVDQRIAP